jgi:hypothetical protein
MPCRNPKRIKRRNEPGTHSESLQPIHDEHIHRILDSKTLKIESDFHRTKDGHYELKSPIMLAVPVKQ